MLGKRFWGGTKVQERGKLTHLWVRFGGFLRMLSVCVCIRWDGFGGLFLLLC